MSFLSKIVKPVQKVLKLGGLTDSIGDTLNGLTGVNSSMDKSYAQQIAMMNQQNAFNREMWNLENEYNSPTAQIARLAQAGVDVNPMTYAVGNGNMTSQASSLQSANGFSGSGSPAGNPVSMLMGVASGIQGLKNAKADFQLKQETQDRTALETDIMRHNLKYAQDHNLPVNSVPGMDATIASVLNRGMTNVKNVPQYTKNVVDKAKSLGYKYGEAIRKFFLRG